MMAYCVHLIIEYGYMSSLVRDILTLYSLFFKLLANPNANFISIVH